MAKTINFGKLTTLFNEFVASSETSFTEYLSKNGYTSGNEFVDEKVKGVKASKSIALEIPKDFDKKEKAEQAKLTEKYKSVIDFLSTHVPANEKDTQRAALLIRGIVEFYRAKGQKLGFKKNKVKQIVTSYDLSDDTSKLEKKHDRLMRFLKKWVAPILATSAAFALVFTALAFSPIMPGVFLTGHLVADLVNLGAIGAGLGAIVSASIIGIKDRVTKNYYNKKYGFKASNIEDLLSSKELTADKLTLTNLKDINLDIVKLLKVIDARDARIAKHPAARTRNYAAIKKNRNALHALAAFVATLSRELAPYEENAPTFDNKSAARFNALSAKKRLTPKEAEELTTLSNQKSAYERYSRISALRNMLVDYCTNKLKDNQTNAVKVKLKKGKDELGKVYYEDILTAIIKGNNPKSNKKGTRFGKVNKNADKDKREGEKLILRTVSALAAAETLGDGKSDEEYGPTSFAGKPYTVKQAKKAAKKEIKEENANNKTEKQQNKKAEKQQNKDKKKQNKDQKKQNTKNHNEDVKTYTDDIQKRVNAIKDIEKLQGFRKNVKEQDYADDSVKKDSKSDVLKIIDARIKELKKANSKAEHEKQSKEKEEKKRNTKLHYDNVDSYLETVKQKTEAISNLAKLESLRTSVEKQDYENPVQRDAKSDVLKIIDARIKAIKQNEQEAADNKTLERYKTMSLKELQNERKSIEKGEQSRKEKQHAYSLIDPIIKQAKKAEKKKAAEEASKPILEETQRLDEQVQELGDEYDRRMAEQNAEASATRKRNAAQRRLNRKKELLGEQDESAAPETPAEPAAPETAKPTLLRLLLKKAKRGTINFGRTLIGKPRITTETFNEADRRKAARKEEERKERDAEKQARNARAQQKYLEKAEGKGTQNKSVDLEIPAEVTTERKEEPSNVSAPRDELVDRFLHPERNTSTGSKKLPPFVRGNGSAPVEEPVPVNVPTPTNGGKRNKKGEKKDNKNADPVSNETGNSARPQTMGGKNGFLAKRQNANPEQKKVGGKTQQPKTQPKPQPVEKKPEPQPAEVVEQPETQAAEPKKGRAVPPEIPISEMNREQLKRKRSVVNRRQNKNDKRTQEILRLIDEREAELDRQDELAKQAKQARQTKVEKPADTTGLDADDVAATTSID